LILDVKLQIYLTTSCLIGNGLASSPGHLSHHRFSRLIKAATASANIALVRVVPNNEHAFLLIPDHFPSFFFVYDTYVPTVKFHINTIVLVELYNIISNY